MNSVLTLLPYYCKVHNKHVNSRSTMKDGDNGITALLRCTRLSVLPADHLSALHIWFGVLDRWLLKKQQVCQLTQLEYSAPCPMPTWLDRVLETSQLIWLWPWWPDLSLLLEFQTHGPFKYFPSPREYMPATNSASPSRNIAHARLACAYARLLDSPRAVPPTDNPLSISTSVSTPGPGLVGILADFSFRFSHSHSGSPLPPMPLSSAPTHTCI
jgi:hypothetical protein